MATSMAPSPPRAPPSMGSRRRMCWNSHIDESSKIDSLVYWLFDRNYTRHVWSNYRRFYITNLKRLRWTILKLKCILDLTDHLIIQVPRHDSCKNKQKLCPVKLLGRRLFLSIMILKRNPVPENTDLVRHQLSHKGPLWSVVGLTAVNWNYNVVW